MFRCQQFVTGDFRPRKVFLEDKVYSLALDALTKACSDILVVELSQSTLVRHASFLCPLTPENALEYGLGY